MLRQKASHRARDKTLNVWYEGVVIAKNAFHLLFQTLTFVPVETDSLVIQNLIPAACNRWNKKALLITDMTKETYSQKRL